LHFGERVEKVCGQRFQPLSTLGFAIKQAVKNPLMAVEYENDQK
jgi:hypothetical protein